MKDKCIVYARMSPENKTKLIQILKDEDLVTAMIGDGPNDIGALKAADVSISLTWEDASMASKFVSTIPNISCLLTLFKEGKASLAFSIQCFKFIIIYSFIQFISVIMLIVLGTYLSYNQFLSVDLFLILPLVILISRYKIFCLKLRTGSNKKLSNAKLNGDIFSFEFILSFILQVLVMLFFQLLSYMILVLQPWYIEIPNSNSTIFDGPSEENTVNYFLNC